MAPGLHLRANRLFRTGTSSRSSQAASSSPTSTANTNPFSTSLVSSSTTLSTPATILPLSSHPVSRPCVTAPISNGLKNSRASQLAAALQDKMQIPTVPAVMPYILESTAPENLVSVKIGKDAKPYVVMKGLIIMRSSYFRAAFAPGRFWEGKTHTCTLADVESTDFEAFLYWCHTGRVIYLEPDFRGTKEQRFYYCIQLYLFADKYETKALRRAILESLLEVIRKDNAVHLQSCYRALNILPPSSKLYLFLSDLMANVIGPASEAEARDMCRQLPLRVTAAMLYSACQSGARPSHPRIFIDSILDQTNGCVYHEHDNEEEEDQCKMKYLINRETLHERCGVKLLPILHPSLRELTIYHILGI